MIIEPISRRVFLSGAVAAIALCPEKAVPVPYLERMVLLYGNADLPAQIAPGARRRFELLSYAFDVPVMQIGVGVRPDNQHWRLP